MSCDEDTLYSYREPIAHKVGDGRFLKNGDRFTPTTSQHQAAMQYALRGEPTVSFGALESAGISPRSITPEQIIDVQKDYTQRVYRNKETGLYHVRGRWDAVNQHYEEVSWTPPEQGMFIPSPNMTQEGYTVGYWHILGGVVIRYRVPITQGANAIFRRKDHLCALDENTYFVSRLRRQVGSVTEAFELLKPEAVRQAEAEGRHVYRQGEWFFIRTGETEESLAAKRGVSKTALRREFRQTPLPVQSTDSNLHMIRHVEVDGQVYATGMVYHRNPFTGRASREHAALDIRDAIYTVHKNTELASWSVGGRFD